jgi:hypothetical protein
LVTERKKLYLAVSSLASGNEDIRERVANAYIYSLIHLHDDDIPIEMKQDFE